MSANALRLIEAQIESVQADIETLELSILDDADIASNAHAVKTLRSVEAAYKDLLTIVLAARSDLRKA